MRRLLLFAFAAALLLVGPPLPPAHAAPLDVAVPEIAASGVSLSAPVPAGATIIPPVASINQFPLFPCRASATQPHVNQSSMPVHHAPEAGVYQQYTNTGVELVHNDNCWSPGQIRAMGNRRAISDITEVVIHWTDLDYQRSVTELEKGVSVHYLIPLTPSATQPPLELIDPRNAAWHAGPLDKGLWEDQAHMLCFPGDRQCWPNGNVHSIGFENVGSSPPNEYQVDVMTDIMAGLIREGYPIVLDRQHVVGHREINSQKPDPGDLDIDHVIALVRQKLAGTSAPPAFPVPPAPTPAPLPAVADGTAAHPFTFADSASGQLTGDGGGKSVFYTLPDPSGQALTVTLAYAGMAAPPGAVLLTVYQDGQQLAQVSPPGNNSSGQSVTVTPRAGSALTLQVVSYLPQTVSYSVSVHT